MSSESDSDDDYVPGKPEQLSEEESADEETEAQYEHESEQKNKRKSLTTQQNGKRKKNSNSHEKTQDSNLKHEARNEEESELDPEVQKKMEDDLWASFLEVGPKSKVATTTNDSVEKVETPPVKATSKPTTHTKEEIKNKEATIFEFAGEKVVVENNVIKEVVKATSSVLPSSSAPTGPVRARGSGGLSNLLGQLNKKNKLSTLEKTKLDWDTFKMKEGLDEEIQNHNKGKDGYLEKQDFLERADLRQFEIERDLRTSRRSNR